MSFPLMNKRSKQAVVVPEFSGGINLRDSVSMIQDNQLTDAVNVWFQDGVLKTRPALKSYLNENLFESVSASENIGGLYLKAKLYPENTVIIGGEKYTLQVTREFFTNGSFVYSGGKCKNLHYRYICNEDPSNIIELGSLNVANVGNNDNGGADIFFQKDGYLYSFVWQEEKGGDTTFNVYKAQIEDGAKHEIVPEDELYAPNVMINCKPGSIIEGEQLEGYNLLTRYYSMQFLAYNQNAESTEMEYSILHKMHTGEVSNGLTWKIRGKIKAELQYVNKNTYDVFTVVHEIEAGKTCETKTNTDGLRMHIANNLVTFVAGNEYNENLGGGPTAKIVKSGDGDYYVLNSSGTPIKWQNGTNGPIVKNLKITAPYCNSIEMYEQQSKVFFMHRNTWFGGESEGINGGTRLFLGGNITDSEKSLLLWSDLNNPLYFSENNYAYLGDSSSAITTFGKQGEYLIIFKEKEIFGTYYQQTSGVTAENIIDQSAIDTSTLFARFPMIQLHTAIGCDCPDTVQLCRNRLVWAESSGKVYTLVSQNQYNERAIFEVSSMIERKLKTEEKANLKTSCAIDWEGRYLLFCGSHVYVMEYNSYGYTHVSSYTKQEDAVTKIPWYYWELPIKPDCAAACCDVMLLPVFIDAGKLAGNTHGYITMAYISGEDGNDIMTYRSYNGNYPDEPYDSSKWTLYTEEYDIYSTLKTKLFEFGAHGYYKNVDKLVLSLGNNGGKPINVSFVTDMGTEEETVMLDGDDTKAYSSGYVKSLQLNPCIRQVERFGVRLSCEGPLAVDGITLTYRITGGVR